MSVISHYPTCKANLEPGEDGSSTPESISHDYLRGLTTFGLCSLNVKKVEIRTFP